MKKGNGELTKEEMQELLAKDFLLLDGALGTMLQQKGLSPGECPELLCFESPDVVRAIHRAYVDNGSEIIYTNSFGANRIKLEGTGYEPAQVIAQAVKVAKGAVFGTGAKVALSVGPIGKLLEPMGELTLEDAWDIFREMVCAGEKAGADLVVFETMTDLYEVKAGVLAAKECTDLPVFVSMTYEETGRTFTGCCVESMAAVLEGLGVDAIGINCSLGPAEILPLAERLAKATTLPVLIKANAGLPDPVTGDYGISAGEFAETMQKYADLGIRIVGGCCGTTPEFIREISRALVGKKPGERKKPETSAVCTPSRFVPLDGKVRVIGENLNPTGKKDIQQALSEGNIDYLVEKAIRQAEAGAEILDINVGMPGIDEAAMMRQVVKEVQKTVDLPLCIDSTNPDAIEAGLRAANGKAIINSVHAKPESMEAVFPLVKKYGAAVIGLAMDEAGLPDSADKRFAIAGRLLNEAQQYGIAKGDLIIDCLTLTVSAQQSQAEETLAAVTRVRKELGLQTALGVSNISFGLPNRALVTRIFLTRALFAGLTLPIINPELSENMDAVAASKVLSGEDQNSAAYIERFGKTALTAQTEAKREERSLGDAVQKGLAQEAVRITEELLSRTEGMIIINEMLIPALDEVGRKFEKDEIFLPQLIHSAAASCAAFDLIRDRMKAAGKGAVSKGKVIVATVKGDVHDIGKNIARVVMENYGYEVIDLGRDVAPEVIVAAAVAEKAKLVGLSALMTTTLPAMKETIEALKFAGCGCKVFVAGAVLTPEYAKEIGADDYAATAQQSAEIAKKVLGK